MLQQSIPNMNQDLIAGQQAPNQDPQNLYYSAQGQGALEQTTSSIDSYFTKLYAENMPINVEELF
ncbi:Uncharacterised protein [Helicobacter muridarum]|uniref:Uncharacterized protein n=2 Tax=Helicobacter muridarum TaxID=216 RepID=A0A377PUI8_9HELI|nr:Uncharacterised protein [Helicobacter muridarum]